MVAYAAPTPTLKPHAGGGPGFSHDYMECFEDFLPKEGMEIYYYILEIQDKGEYSQILIKYVGYEKDLIPAYLLLPKGDGPFPPSRCNEMGLTHFLTVLFYK